MNGPESESNMPKKCPQCGATLSEGALEGLCPACLLKEGTAETGTQPESAPFRPPTVEDVARLFPQLEILSLLGKGGMGAVYKARQPALDRFVALKILPPQAATGPGFAERFTREARALARLIHPNIVAVHEFGVVAGVPPGGPSPDISKTSEPSKENPEGGTPPSTSGGTPNATSLPYFIMEFVDGPTLRQLERSGKLSPREALQIVPQICEALQFAHDEGVVHRDIKPENILLDKKGRVKIADFGIAKIMGREPNQDLTETRGVVGTPHYMAPEQVEKPEAVDHRADIFALGVVFYEMLTGELPLGRFGPPSSRLRGVGVDVRLDEVVLRALEKEPERRYQQASQVKTAVETIAGSASPGESAPPPSRDPARFAQEILGRDYVLDIGSCFSRGWALFGSDFWAILGVSALITLTINAAHTVGLGLFLAGPLMGGLWLYLLKKKRGEKADVALAFSGFGPTFLSLMLAGFVSTVLMFLGFFCLIIPGIYVLVAWKFALPLVADKGLGFWAAMELSRKAVGKHWFKFFGFWIASFLINGLGFFLLCGIGLFITFPLTLAALVYAYEDVFSATSTQPARLGPSGTVVLPESAGSGGVWKFAVAALAIVATAFTVVFGLYALSHSDKRPVRPITLVDTNTAFRATLSVLDVPPNLEVRQIKQFAALLDHPQVRVLAAPVVVVRNGTEAEIRIPDYASLTNALSGAIHNGKSRTFCITPALKSGSSVVTYQLKRRRLDGSITNFKRGSVRPGEFVVIETTGRNDRKQIVVLGFEVEQPPGPAEQSARAALRSDLQFRWVAGDDDADVAVDELSDPRDSTGETKLRVLKEVVLDGKSVVSGGISVNEPGRKELLVLLTDEGRQKFADISRENVGRRFAIVWLGQVLSAPVIQSPVSSPNVVITGNISDTDAQQLIDVLNRRSDEPPGGVIETQLEKDQKP